MTFGSDITETIGNVGGRTTTHGYNSADSVRKRYTGYEHDDESKLDFAQARYYNSSHGRFTSVDPLTASANVKNPQTFNRYSYVLNSPYKYTDPLGLIPSQPIKYKKANDEERSAFFGRVITPTAALASGEVPESHSNNANDAPTIESTIGGSLAEGAPSAEEAEPPPSSDDEEIVIEVVVVSDKKIEEISNKISAELNAGLKRERLILRRDGITRHYAITRNEVEKSFNPIKIGSKEIDIPANLSDLHSGGSNPVDGNQEIFSDSHSKLIDNRLETSENVNEIIRNVEIELINYKSSKGTQIDESERTRAITVAIENGIKNFNTVRPKK